MLDCEVSTRSGFLYPLERVSRVRLDPKEQPAATQEEIMAYLDSMNRSLEAITCPLSIDTRRLANLNLANCQTWLKEHGVEFYYDGKEKRYKQGKPTFKVD